MINVDELKIGDSFIYKTDKGKVVGFFLINKETSNNKVAEIRFGLVAFRDSSVSNIEDFKKGELFTHKVWSGLSGDYEIGIQCYDFSSKNFDFLDKFLFLGNIKFDTHKFTLGGGGVFNNELFMNLEMNNLETNKSKYEKKPLKFIMD